MLVVYQESCRSSRSIAVHQLLPELAADIAEVDIVIFVDAVVTVDRSIPKIEIISLVAGGDENFSTHIITPQLLLGITKKLYCATPVAYLLTIPAIDLTVGANLSSIASRGKELALDYLKSADSLDRSPIVPASNDDL
jgi:hydrogenase maturation protease